MKLTDLMATRRRALEAREARAGAVGSVGDEFGEFGESGESGGLDSNQLSSTGIRLRAEDTVPWSAQVAGAWSLRFLLIVAAIYVLLNLLNAISLVTITLIVAMMINALLGPMVGWLVDRGVPRPLAALGIFIGGVGLIGVGLWFVVMQTTQSWEDLNSQVVQGIQTIQQWLITGPLHLSQAQVDQFSTDLTAQLSANKGAIVGGALQAANSALGIASGMAFTLFALLFMLFDNGAIRRWMVGIFPTSAEKRIYESLTIAWQTLVAYMRSTVILAVINAATMVIIMMIAGMPLVMPLGVLLFLGSLIPLIGMIVAGVVVCLVALVTKGGIVALVILIALFLTVQLEGNLLNPFILGRAVSIHPLAILIGVTAGSMVGGIFGAFVAVPFVAVVSNVGRELRRAPIVLPLVVPAVAEPEPSEPDVPQPPVVAPRED